ncbi:MAG: phenylalanine--tRNA ligase subunit alpha [Spirochaetales bacterium]|nr:phenylalanine--tRNA ligase subunit alpha [Spirochaetales bacterium]
MEKESIIKGLHPLEIKVLLQFTRGEKLTNELLMDTLSFNLGQCNQVFSWLSQKALIKESQREKHVFLEITELGEEYHKAGTPEECMIRLLEKEGPLTLPDIAKKMGIENKDAGSAFGSLSKEGVLLMDKEKRVCIGDCSGNKKMDVLKDLIASVSDQGQVLLDSLTEEQKGIVLQHSKKRGSAAGIFKIAEREKISYSITDDGVSAGKALKERGITGEEIGILTPEILARGEWKTKGFRGYNINVPPSRVLLGRKNPYVNFLVDLKDKLISLGFEEFEGPLVETEFWNSDALFMPQFHSARDIHDVFYITEPQYAKEIENPYLDHVAKTHENGWETGSRGWNYSFDRNFTKRLILRSQGTVLSAKTLTKAKIPGKYFGVVRCFRPDTVDATHAADFYQIEGIVLGEHVHLKNLLGLLKVFAVEVAGSKEVKYVPAYFPFTEPSVEVHIKHDVLGWFELGGSGIFRPEVTKPLGINVPVLAWGLGIDRMALLSLGLNDLRDLFTSDIEQVRLRKRRNSYAEN